MRGIFQKNEPVSSPLILGTANIYQLLHQYHKILAACNIRGERACEFSFNIAQSQYFVVLMQQLFHRIAKIFRRTI